MKQLALIMLAASALAPVSAAAQQRTAAPPVKWEDTPNAQMRMPGGHAPIGHAPMVRPPHHGQSHAAPHHVRGNPPVAVQHHGPVRVHARNGEGIGGRHHRGNRMGMRGHHGFKNYSNYRRIDRGFFLPQPWWGQGYHIQNYSMYGLPQPIGGGRWVRYYDDALMVDAGGRVHDGRYGMAWDEWQDQWAYDDRGVPVYSGDGDFYPGDEDYAWVAGEGQQQAYGHHQGYAHGGCQQSCAYQPVAPGYGYGYGYGHGWGYGAGMVVTETTVTTAPTVVTETWVEEEVVYEQRARKARKYRAKPRYHRARPQPGERG
jgi:Ni/Co efflux regulator RcnB